MDRFPTEDFGREFSSKDRSILNSEVEEEAASSVANERTKFIKYEQLQEDLDVIIEAYFPEELKKFSRPSLGRIFFSLAQSVNSIREGGEFNEKKIAALSDTKISLLMAAAIIRYVDNFIDEGLWPHIKEYDKEVLRNHFKSFLERSLAVAKFYDPDMPDSIIELPLLEMGLELDPSQSNFDESIPKLVRYKSLDIYYLDSLLAGLQAEGFKSSLDDEHYLAVSLQDLLRDFDPGRYPWDTDFNLRNYIGKHNLDPKVLVSIIDDAWTAEDFPRDGNHINRSLERATGELEEMRRRKLKKLLNKI